MAKKSIKFIWYGLLSIVILAGSLHVQSQKEPPTNPMDQTSRERNLTLPKVFHIVGISGLNRNDRGDLHFTEREIIFQKGKKQLLILPYERLRRVQLLSGERHYGKTTAGAAAATPLGALLVLKKRKVDTLIFDYANERGGLKGMVLQVPEKQGTQCKEWLARFGVTVEEPAPMPAVPPEKKQ